MTTLQWQLLPILSFLKIDNSEYTSLSEQDHYASLIDSISDCATKVPEFTILKLVSLEA